VRGILVRFSSFELIFRQNYEDYSKPPRLFRVLGTLFADFLAEDIQRIGGKQYGIY
jgi:hypothetical protein